MDSYKTIMGEAESAFTERKSEFISYIRHVETEDEAIAFINEIRSRHRKAAHNCYAYILRDNNTARHSDDGEPQGTAGIPIYDTLRKEELTDTACVVTRYFGGIMLGAGGLVRAYGKGAADAVNAAKVSDFHMAAKLELIISYPMYGKIKRLPGEYGAILISEDFGEKVSVTLVIKEENADDFEREIIDICAGDVVVNKLQKEYCDFG